MKVRARDNPLSTDRVLAVRYRFVDGSMEDLLRRLDQLKFRGALVGPRGSGKTTLLEDLVRPLQARGFRCHFVRLTEDCPSLNAVQSRQLAACGPEEVILLDGAEQMGPVRWRWFRWRVRRAGGLVVSLHRPGRLPMAQRCATSPALLTDVLAELLPATVRPGPVRLEELFRRHDGNLREVLRDLYDDFAAGVAGGGQEQFGQSRA